MSRSVSEWCLKKQCVFLHGPHALQMLKRYMYNLPLLLPSYLAIISTQIKNKSSDQALGVPFRNHGDNNGEEDEDAEMTRCAS